MTKFRDYLEPAFAQLEPITRALASIPVLNKIFEWLSRHWVAICFFSVCGTGLAWYAATTSFIIRGALASGTQWASALDALTWPAYMAAPMWPSDPIDQAVGAGAIAIIALIVLYRRTMTKNYRTGEEHGSATWAKPHEITKYTNRKDPQANLKFTATESLSLDSHVTKRNLNAFVIGSSGSGKSRFFVMPNLHQANTSFVITDPKGELYAQCAPYLESKGYKIRQFNLVDFDRSDHYNPLAYINPARAEIDVAILTENFISNTSGKKPTGENSFWEKAERALLQALICIVYFTGWDSGRTPSFSDVIDLLSRMGASEQDEDKMTEIDMWFSAIKAQLDAYDHARAAGETYTADTEIMMEGLRYAQSQYNIYTQGAGETKKSVIISLGVRVAPLHMAHIRNLLSRDTINIDAVGQEKTALFLIIPDTHDTFSFLVSIFYEQLFERSIYIADHTPGGRLPELIQCFMDEFANIGKMPSFERKIAVMRSRGISTALIMQTFSQGKSLYKDDWETIIGNCDSFLFLGGAEQSTTEYVTKRLGKQTIDTLDTSQTKGASGSFSKSFRTTGRDLMTPDELARMDNTECIYMLRGVPPFKSRKLDAPNDTPQPTLRERVNTWRSERATRQQEHAKASKS